MKYLRYNAYGFVVWSESMGISHAAMVDDLKSRGVYDDDLISAGFVQIDADGHLCCYGESVSLKIKSHPDDSHLIREKFLS